LIQKYKPKGISNRKRKKIKEFVVNETLIKVGYSELIKALVGCNFIWRFYD
jgi:hypothetical protein